MHTLGWSLAVTCWQVHAGDGIEARHPLCQLPDVRAPGALPNIHVAQKQPQRAQTQPPVIFSPERYRHHHQYMVGALCTVSLNSLLSYFHALHECQGNPTFLGKKSSHDQQCSSTFLPTIYKHESMEMCPERAP